MGPLFKGPGRGLGFPPRPPWALISAPRDTHKDGGRGMTTGTGTGIRLKINEIYLSLQGESTYAGLPCVFVRLTGYSLRCTWCDTTYAFYEGKDQGLDSILAKVDSHGVKLMEITDDEPLEQEGVYPLMEGLLKRGYKVL